MRPIQYAANVSTDARKTYTPRPVTNPVAVVLVSVGTFVIFWMVAMLTALLMVR